MADFSEAIETVLHNEGGFVDDPDDDGGATNWGISLRFYKKINPSATVEDIKNLTPQRAMEIYKQYFWDPNHYGDIKDIDIATKVFDAAVNSGPVPANICLQRAIKAQSPAQILLEDGVLGPKSIAAINSYDKSTLLPALKSELAGHYRQIADKKYLNGWLHRAYSDRVA